MSETMRITEAFEKIEKGYIQERMQSPKKMGPRFLREVCENEEVCDENRYILPNFFQF